VGVVHNPAAAFSGNMWDAAVTGIWPVMYDDARLFSSSRWVYNGTSHAQGLEHELLHEMNDSVAGDGLRDAACLKYGISIVADARETFGGYVIIIDDGNKRRMASPSS
jgi:hypothetical protein